MKKLFSLIAAVLFAGSMMAAEVTDVLNNALTGVSGTNYAEWSGKQASSDAVYAGQSAGGNSSIQLRSNNNNSGVITTASGGKLKSITVKFNSNTQAARVLDIYASNEAYTAASDLYGDKAGTKVVSFKMEDGAEQSYTFEDEYTFFGFRSASGALYVEEVDVVWTTDGEAPAVAKPVITGDAVFFDSTIVTMSCTTPETDIYYTTDGNTDPRCDCAAAPEYSEPIVLKATTTVKAAAYTGNDWSAVAEKVFTKAPSFASFEELIAAELADKSLVEVSFENILIDSIYVSSQGKRQGLYFTVNEKVYEIYYNKAEVPETWVAGGAVSGTIRGTWTLYAKANVWEIVPIAEDWAWALTYEAAKEDIAFEFVIENNVLTITPSNDDPWAGMTIPVAVIEEDFGGDIRFMAKMVADMVEATPGEKSLDLSKLDPEELPAGTECLFVAWGYVESAVTTVDSISFTVPEEKPIAKDTVEIAVNKGLIFVDYTSDPEEGWWDLYGANEEYEFEISNTFAEQAEGVYAVEDLDPDFTYIIPVGTEDTIRFTDGQLALSIVEDAVMVAGDLLGQDDVLYRFLLVYTDPVAEDTVVVEIPEAELYDEFTDLGLYVIYGSTEDENTYVQLGIWAEEFEGEFSKDDLDDEYMGSFIKVGDNYETIFSAAIEVIPGNGEGVYKVTADLLCYNGVLYQVTMLVGEEEQAVDEIDAAKKVIKAIKNGQLIIEKNGAQYNVLGARL